MQKETAAMAQQDLVSDVRGSNGRGGDDAVEGDQPAKLGRKRDHTRDPEILQAAIDVLAECGYERMTIDMVATRAKAGKATLYRRWSSKGELVVEAIACMKKGEFTPEKLPDTGTLRGDLLAMIRPHSLEESERKLQVMGAVASMLSRDPQLAEAVAAAITEPRTAINRALMQRAVDRGEVRADADIETIAQIGPSMAAYRTLAQRKPVDREFLVSIIDGVVLPALGLRPGG
jgi:AcrR family transcriptional regulator